MPPSLASAAAEAGRLVTAPLPPLLYLPLQMYRSLPLRAVVGAGSRVRAGDVVAVPMTADGVPLLAPVDGVIDGVVDHPAPLPGTPAVPTLLLASAGTEHLAAGVARWPALAAEAPAGALLARLREAGVLGLGGAAFPVAGKLGAARAAGVHTLIVNACACAAGAHADAAVLALRPDAVALGIHIVERLLGVTRTLLAIPPAAPAAGRLSAALSALPGTAIRDAVACTGDAIAGEGAPRAPGSPEAAARGVAAGAERRLAALATGARLRAGELPLAAGCVCQNVATFAQIADAVAGMLPSGRIVTVDAGGAACNVAAYHGTPIRDVLATAGAADAALSSHHVVPVTPPHGAPQGAGTDATTPAGMQWLVGGAHAGYRLADVRAPVTAHVHAVTRVAVRAATPCIGCGRCDDACPEHLPARLLHRALAAGTPPPALTPALAACLECGACDAACPSAIPLTEGFRHGRALQRYAAVQSAQAAQARDRFAAHTRRTEAARAAAAAAAAARRARRQRGPAT
jgi:electron transport complex protein RnfC